jgi:hypothetical protein
MLLITVGWLFCGLCFWYALAVLHQRTTDRREQQTAEMQARGEARDAAVEIEKQLSVEAKKRMSEGGRHKGVSTLTPLELGKARDKAAALVGASPRYVQDAKQIERDAPELLDEVIQGKLSIPQAKRVAALPIEQRPAAIERIHNKVKRRRSLHMAMG